MKKNPSMQATCLPAENPAIKELRKHSKDELIKLLLNKQSERHGCPVLAPKGKDLIGTKVVFNEYYYKKRKPEHRRKLPDCGYFIIESAFLMWHGKVLVKLNANPEEHGWSNWELATDFLTPYVEND